MVEQYDIYWTELDPVQGKETAKTRPCVIVSPTELNSHLGTVIISPVTSTIRNYPYRVRRFVAGRMGDIATNQIRAVDKSRLKGKVGELRNAEIADLQEVFSQMFCV